MIFELLDSPEIHRISDAHFVRMPATTSYSNAANQQIQLRFLILCGLAASLLLLATARYRQSPGITGTLVVAGAAGLLAAGVLAPMIQIDARLAEFEFALLGDRGRANQRYRGPMAKEKAETTARKCWQWWSCRQDLMKPQISTRRSDWRITELRSCSAYPASRSTAS